MNETDIHTPEFDPEDIRLALEDALATGGNPIALVDSLEVEGYNRGKLIETLSSIPDPTKPRVAVITLALLLVALNLFATIKMHTGGHIGSHVWICGIASLLISVEIIRMRAYVFRVAAICSLGFAGIDLKYANDGGILVFPLMVIAAMLFYYIGFNLFPYYTLAGPKERHHGELNRHPLMVVFLIIAYLVLEGIFGIFPVIFFAEVSPAERISLCLLLGFPPVLFILAAIARERIEGSHIRTGIIITGWLWLALLVWIAFAVTPWMSWDSRSFGSQSLKPFISYSFGGFLARSMLLSFTSGSEKRSLRRFAREHGPFLLYLLLIVIAHTMPRLMDEG